MKIRCVWEHNGPDSIVYAQDLPGAFTRGESLEKALEKMNTEIHAYSAWTGREVPEAVTVDIVQEVSSGLDVRDADSDALFAVERAPLSETEYQCLKKLALKSAGDFQKLYDSIPDKHRLLRPVRPTFYGTVPATADEMYLHTKNVNNYYFAEIDVDADNEGTILACRERGFQLLEQKADYLRNPVFEGSCGEAWTLRKVIRRFIWHDRIHGKAMYRGAEKHFGSGIIFNSFFF